MKIKRPAERAGHRRERRPRARRLWHRPRGVQQQRLDSAAGARSLPARPTSTCGGKKHAHRRRLHRAEERDGHRSRSTYSKKCAGQQVNYNPSGSGAGVKQFNANQIDFGGSDSPIKDADAAAAKARCASDAWNIPMVVGPIAVAYKLSGVDKPDADPVGDRQDLQRWHHQVERPGHQGGQGQREPEPAGQAHPGRLAAPTSRAPPTTSRSTWRGGEGRLDQGRRQEVQRWRRQRCAGLQRRRDRGKATDGGITYVEGRVRQGRADHRPSSTAAPAAVELNAANAAKSLDAAKFLKERLERPRARPQLASTPARPRAPTRCCWPPTRSSARSTRTRTSRRPSRRS